MNKLNEYYRKFVYKITDIFARKYEKGSDEYQIMAFRVFGWIDTIVKASVFLLIAYYCGVFFITLPIYIAFVASKWTSGGLHLRNHITCTLVTLSFLVGGAFLVRLIPDIAVMPWIRLAIWACCMPVFAIFAPMNNAARTFYPKEKKRFKLLSIATVATIGLFIIYFASIHQPTTANALLFGVLVQTICILPCISKSNIVSAEE